MLDNIKVYMYFKHNINSILKKKKIVVIDKNCIL